jgi:hypothetical protein
MINLRMKTTIKQPEITIFTSDWLRFNLNFKATYMFLFSSREKTMKRIFILLIFTVPFFYGCPIRCDQIEVQTSTLNELSARQVPYVDGGSYSLKHSAGKTINFSCARKITDEISHCYECCQEFKYQVDETILTPDYPIPSITLRIMSDEENRSNMSVHFGRSYFIVPVNWENEMKVDSIEIGNKFYHDVYRLKNIEYSFNNSWEDLADSLYYNKENGILKITLHNGEHYVLSE